MDEVKLMDSRRHTDLTGFRGNPIPLEAPLGDTLLNQESNYTSVSTRKSLRPGHKEYNWGKVGYNVSFTFVMPLRNGRNYILPYAEQQAITKKVIAMRINKPESFNNTIRFLHDFEKKVGISPPTRYYERIPGTYIVVFNSEWIKTPLRYSLVTLLLKAGLKYTINNIDEYIDMKYEPKLDDSEVLYYKNYFNNTYGYSVGGEEWRRISDKLQFIISEGNLNCCDVWDWKQITFGYGSGRGFIEFPLDKQNKKFIVM